MNQFLLKNRSGFESIVKNLSSFSAFQKNIYHLRQIAKFHLDIRIHINLHYIPFSHEFQYFIISLHIINFLSIIKTLVIITLYLI